MARPDRIRVLFVCMGNICRSPLAEGVFLHKINERGVAHRFEVDSAGTGGWHVGQRPDDRSIHVAARYGVHLPGRARLVEDEDYERFDHIICMDRINERHLLESGAPRERLRLLLEHHPETDRHEVPDPYSGDADGFQLVYELVDRACDALIDDLLDGGSSE